MLCESEFLGTVGVDVGVVLNEINHVLTRVQKQKKPSVGYGVATKGLAINQLSIHRNGS
jgi:hypothetical protein